MDFVVLEAGPRRGRRRRRVGARATLLRVARARRPRRPPAPRRGRHLDGARRRRLPDRRRVARRPTCSRSPTLLDATAGGSVRYDTRVVGVGRAGRDLLVDSGREDDPFAVHVEGPAGRERLLASAVVDASGTWTRPNPLGADGYPALGETRARRADHLRHPRLQRPGRRRAVRRQARRRRRQGRLGAGSPRRPGRAGQDGPRHPGLLAAAPPRPWATRSAAGTTTSSSSAASSARTPRPPPAAASSPT